MLKPSNTNSYDQNQLTDVLPIPGIKRASAERSSMDMEEIRPKDETEIGVCLVLGGGGARGTAHVAVLEVLEEAGVPIDMIVGASVGGVIGAFYADYVDAKKVKEKILPVKMWDLLELSYIDTIWGFIEPKGGVDGENLKNYICDNMCAKNIEDLQIPLVLVTTDIVENEIFIIEKGPLAAAVHASAALPPVFTPVELYGKMLADGGILEPVPVSTAKKYGPKLIIAVNIISPAEKGKPENMVHLLSKVFDNAYYELSRVQCKAADIVIHPDLKGFGMFEDHRNLEAYEKGKEAAKKALPLIRSRMAALGIASKRGKEKDYYDQFNKSLMRKSTS